MRRLALLIALIAAPAQAQLVSSLYPPVTSADLAAIQAQVPVPANAAPPAEIVGGAAGATMTFRRGDAIQPRITRATACTLVTGGTCTATYTPDLPATDPNIILTPINSGSAPVICNLTAAATVNSASIKCWINQTTTLSLAIITAGINLIPFANAPAGTVIQIVALPKS